MEYEEYAKKSTMLAREYKEKIDTLRKEFAISRNDISVGDVITDKWGTTIRVSKYLPEIHLNAFPQMCYYGNACKKDGKPKKTTATAKIVQQDVKILNGESYTYSFS